jgi:pimeloyl-ACP methyl ester carboxylesterase
METSTLHWSWAGNALPLGVTSGGQGPSVLLLPALSSISTRHEMRPLQERLAGQYATTCVDWPGFGDQARPQVDWSPDIYSAFLSFVLTSVVAHPHAIVAAGHAASYALKHVAGSSQATTRLVLIAPTWRGPLPTMMGGRRSFAERICRMVDRPAIGPVIYWLNVNPFVVRHMVAGHVFADPAFLHGERLREKRAVVRAPGARFASVRFVTGRLDPVADREPFLDFARRTSLPMLVLYGAETPPKSRAEIEALAGVPGVRCRQLAHGKLSVHEEFPDATAAAIGPFLGEDLEQTVQ